MVEGIHHVSMKCGKGEEFEKVKHFYGSVLGLDVCAEWAEGIMFDAGGSRIEIFCTAGDEYDPGQGIIRHFALAVDSADDCARAVRQAGYEVFIEPKDIVIKSDPPIRARIAFCRGVLGEEIELFEQE